MDREEIDNITAPFLASDLAVEVRNVYFEHAGTGIGPGAATAAVFDAFRNLLDDPNEGPVIFLALGAAVAERPTARPDPRRRLGPDRIRRRRPRLAAVRRHHQHRPAGSLGELRRPALIWNLMADSENRRRYSRRAFSGRSPWGEVR